jgi:hypothetical protein
VIAIGAENADVTPSDDVAVAVRYGPWKPSGFASVKRPSASARPAPS